MRARVADMTFVLRTAGERTAPAALRWLRELVARGGGDPGSQVHSTEAKPFAAALRAAFRLGLESDRPWLVALDADVLLLESALDRLAGLCSRAEPDVFKIGPLVLCKFHGGLGHCGVHCYPRGLLVHALKLNVDEAVLRPETAIAQAMAKDGFVPFSPATVVGVHDFEQSYKHIYLKMRLRALREISDQRAGRAHASFEHRLAETQARADASSDPDLRVACWGLADGAADAAIDAQHAPYDWDAAYPELDRRLREAGLAEKPAWDGPARGFAERAIAEHDFGSDLRTPEWVRQRHGFAGGREQVLGKLGLVASAPGAAAPAGSGAAA